MEIQSASDAALMLFEKYGDEIYRYVRYTIADKSYTEDVVQDIFLRVLQSWKRFNHKSSLKTWLWSISNNCIREHFRRTEKQLSRNVPLVGEFTDDSAFQHDIEMMELEESIQQLNVAQRQVFVERVIHMKSTAETAKLLGWSQVKVRTTLHRAMKKIRDVVRKGEDTRE